MLKEGKVKSAQGKSARAAYLDVEVQRRVRVQRLGLGGEREPRPPAARRGRPAAALGREQRRELRPRSREVGDRHGGDVRLGAEPGRGTVADSHGQ